MASLTGTGVSVNAYSLHQSKAKTAVSSLKSVSFSSQSMRLSSWRMRPIPRHLHVFRAAKQETVDKVCDIVRKQLALPEDSTVTGESKFAQLGADSLDTVEIVMGLEEAFGISVEEESAQTIATVEDAANLIDKLVEKKDA